MRCARKLFYSTQLSLMLAVICLSAQVHASNLSQFFSSSSQVSGNVLIISGTSWTPPAGVKSVDVVVIGGGGGGGAGSFDTNCDGGRGGHSGYMDAHYNVPVTPGVPITISIGAGATGVAAGGSGTPTTGSPTCFDTTYCSGTVSASRTLGAYGASNVTTSSGSVGTAGTACTVCSISIPTTSGSFVSYPENNGAPNGAGIANGGYRGANGGSGAKGFRFDKLRNVTTSATYYGSGGNGGEAQCDNSTGALLNQYGGSTGTAGAIYIRW